MARMPDDMAARYGAILEEFDRAIKVLNESKSDTLTELRGELKSLGYEGGEIGAEVAMLKAAVKQIGMSQRERQKADDKDEGVSDYITVLSLARARAREDEPEHDADGVIIEPNSAPAESPPSAMVERATGTPSDGLHDAGEAAVAPQVEASPAEIQPPASAAQTVTVSEGLPVASSSPEHEAVESLGPVSPAGEVAAAKSGEASVASPAPPAKKRWTFNDPAHRDCLDPSQCGGFSNLKLCERCRLAAAADVHLEAAE